MTSCSTAQHCEGDIVISSLSAASADDRSVDNPARVDFDRGRSPHLAFNTGQHNCAGSHLARLELRIFLEEWLARVPLFALAPDYVPRARGGPVMVLERLDSRW